MAAATKSTLLAVDTNFLLDLAADTAVSWEALETIRRRLPDPIILVPPTVIDELVVGHDDPTDRIVSPLDVDRAAQEEIFADRDLDEWWRNHGKHLVDESGFSDCGVGGPQGRPPPCFRLQQSSESRPLTRRF